MFKKIVKWGLLILSILLIGILVTSWYLVSTVNKAFEKTYQVEPVMITIPDDSASLAKGEKWTKILCSQCHGDQLQGFTMFDDPAIGRFDGTNLTSGKGGIGSYYTDKDWIRAIRHGIKPNGKGAFVMPSNDFKHMGDEDLGSMIAYLKTIAAYDHETNPPEIKTFAKVLAAMGAFGELFAAESIDHTNKKSPVVPEIGPTAEYGAYMVNVFGCRTCHGMDLAGGKDPDPNAPFGPNLTPGGDFANWSSSDFIKSMRQGVNPDGKVLSKYMPWLGIRNMNDTELIAIYNHLQALPARETPSEFRTE